MFFFLCYQFVTISTTTTTQFFALDRRFDGFLVSQLVSMVCQSISMVCQSSFYGLSEAVARRNNVPVSQPVSFQKIHERETETKSVVSWLHTLQFTVLLW